MILSWPQRGLSFLDVSETQAPTPHKRACENQHYTEAHQRDYKCEASRANVSQNAEQNGKENRHTSRQQEDSNRDHVDPNWPATARCIEILQKTSLL